MIRFKNNVFQIDTLSSSYVFCVKPNFLKHIYYGRKIPFESGIAGLSDTYPRIWAVSYDDRLSETYDLSEFPCDGAGDFRPCSIALVNERGEDGCAFLYDGYEIADGIAPAIGLPSPRGENAQTLCVKLRDYYGGAVLYLYYTVYADSDVILRRSRIVNEGSSPVTLKKVMSSDLDFRETDLDIAYLYGRNANEKHFARRKIGNETLVLESKNGISGHSLSPFYMLCDPCACETSGRTFGVQLMYSGSFKAEIACDGIGNVRANIGVNDYKFSYTLEPRESFGSPWAVLCFSDRGFNGVSQIYNTFAEKYVLPSRFTCKSRPVAVNTWDSCVFDVNEEKCLKIIDKAAEIGADLFVIDDGWFGRRDKTEEDGLGDWSENKSKFPRGLEFVSAYARSRGLKFGLWIEPEAVSPKSDYFAANPDRALVYGKKPFLMSRHEYLLDFSNPQVVDEAIKVVCSLVDRLKLDYIKYDMNRPLCEHVSSVTENGKLAYRYMLGVYRLLDTLTRKYPDLLIENCSSGGGRYDLGMCAYCPQTWISDNTNPFERARIAYYSSLMLPPSTAVCHTVGRERCPSASHDFIYDCAKTRVFGVENDLLGASTEELSVLKREVAEYKQKYAEFICRDLYRLGCTETELVYLCVTKDKSEATLFVVKLRDEANPPYRQIRLYGLDENKLYSTGRGEFYGETLTNVGYPISELSAAGTTFETTFTATDRKESHYE